MILKFKAVNKHTNEEHGVSSISMDENGKIFGFFVNKKGKMPQYQTYDGNYKLIPVEIDTK